ncbi:MAG: recombinase family protein [Lachnospiraceae bacterium]|nr:recombinase family protein [Lachnospiraceae bacterium]MCM1239904.1 recombinase family protein [Lachnospiraceae bacterium]
MARISRKSVKEVLNCTQYIFDTALYVRLSLEEQEEDSTEKIKNQRELLLQYVTERPEHQLADIYCDNGCTGTDFDRPEWQRLMEDAKAGKINCIIVKDLSRLGRNYIEAGDYLENVFPRMGIRFIAISDGYDSANLKPEDTGLLLPLKNIINASYAKDLSRKISSAKHVQRGRGEFTGSVAPFGYEKDKHGKGRFVVNEEEAEVVRKIFQMFGEGESYTGVAKELNRLKIPSPQGKIWRYQTIRGIIANQVYLGKMVQGKYCGLEADIVTVDNTHEAIIAEELFEKAASRREKISLHREKEVAAGWAPDEEYLFRGMLKAENSGLTLCRISYRKQSGQVLVKAYRSPKAFDQEGNPYKLIMIREEVLLSAVKIILLQYFCVLEDTRFVLSQDAMQKKYQRKIKRMEGEVQALYKEIMRKKELLSDSYQDMADGILEPSDYQKIQRQYKEDIVQVEQKVRESEKRLAEYKRLVNLENPYISILREFGKSLKTTRDLLALLVSEITVTGSREIRIAFSFEDEFRNLCALVR